MLKYFVVIASLFITIHCYSQKPANKCSEKDSSQWATTSLGCLHFYAFKNDSLSFHPNLIIVLHGDAPFNNPGYQYAMAKQIAKQNQNTVAVGVLRPGYTDPDGNTSDGIRGLTTGDNYTLENIKALSEVIQHLKSIYHPKQTVLVGHSGGAAIAADIIALQPELLQKAVLVSCPCDLITWRNYMSQQQPTVLQWKEPVKSISPLNVIGNIHKSTEVVIITGLKDNIAPSTLSVAYYKTLQRYGVKSELISVPEKGHEILLNDSVFVAIKNLLKQ